MKWLNPRTSGLITFKGGGGGASTGEVQNIVDSSVGVASDTGTTTGNTGSFTTAVVTNTDSDGNVTTTGGDEVTYGGQEVGVTDTVKGDTEAILGGQSTTDDLINKRFDTFGGGGSSSTTNVYNEIDTEPLAKTVDMDAGFARSITNQDANTAKILADTGQIGGQVGDIASDVSGLGTAVDSGFASVGSDLDTLGTGQAGITTKVDDLSGNVTERFNTVDNTLDTGFAGVNTNLDNRFAAQNEDLTDLSANVLGGQTNLQNYLEGISGRADTYYGGLAEGQAGLLENVGGLQTNFQDFRDTYDTNTNLANQTRGELLDTVSGGFNNMRGAIADNFSDTRSDVNRVASQVDNVQSRQAAATQSQGMDLTQSIRDLASGLQASDRNQVASQNEVANRISTVKNVLLNEGNNIPDDIRSQYTDVANAFDDSGRLIRQSTNAEGLVTRRSMNEQTDLLSAQFDQRGNSIGQSVVNVNSLLTQMEKFGYTGGNSASGALAPQGMASQRAAVESGLMQRQEPFSRTFG
jgi:hypothetical protein